VFSLAEYVSNKKLGDFCRRNHITKISLFGSALRNKLRADSDIDILVDFDPEYIPGLFELSGMEIELSEMIGRKVDLRTAEELSRYFRDEVLKKARIEYVA
jgi:predicted nucleotidyltransferase